MPEQVRVWAKPEKMIGHPTVAKAFIGYERVLDPKQAADHEVPGGARYRLRPEGEVVIASSYVRRACARGDLESEAEHQARIKPLLAEACKAATEADALKQEQAGSAEAPEATPQSDNGASESEAPTTDSEG